MYRRRPFWISVRHGFSSPGPFGDFCFLESGMVQEAILKISAFYIFFPGTSDFGANAPGLLSLVFMLTGWGQTFS